MVKVYDKERSICNLIMERNKNEMQDFQTAIKEYMSSKKRYIVKIVIDRHSVNYLVQHCVKKTIDTTRIW